MNDEKIIKVLKAAFEMAVREHFGFNGVFDVSVQQTKAALKEFGITANCFDRVVSVDYYAKKYKEQHNEQPTITNIKKWFEDVSGWEYRLSDAEAETLMKRITLN